MNTKKTKNKPIIWTISGSDCSGGAGIAADIKTGHVLGCEVCHLITANTVQNSEALISVNPIEVDILAAQAKALIEDKPPQAIKIGLIANTEQITWLVEILTKIRAKLPRVKVVYDPVGQASVGGINGGNFSRLSASDLLPLFPLIDVITPNANEAKLLVTALNTEGVIATNEHNIKSLATDILSLKVNSVIIKGGHSLNSTSTPSTCLDYCLHTLTDDDSSKMSQDEIIEYGLSSQAITTTYSHGGGCSFASALAAFFAQGHLLRDAFTLTKAFINQGLTAHVDKQDKYGAFEQTTKPNHANFFPIINESITDKYKDLPAFPSLGLDRKQNDAKGKAQSKGQNKEQNKYKNKKQTEKLGLYPVIDSLYWLERLLPLNLNIIQLRIKNQTGDELEQTIIKAIELNKQYPTTRLFINDYWQLAIKHGAYGVHIGQEDLQDADLTKIQQAGIRLGISTHGCYEFLLAQQLQPSYLAIGAIYSTKTKNMTGQIQGIENLIETLRLATHIPVVAIGGINHQRAVDVLATGVDSIAVVTAITEADNPEESVAKFNQLIYK